MKYRYKRGGCYDYSARRQVKQWFNDYYTACDVISRNLGSMAVRQFVDWRDYVTQP